MAEPSLQTLHIDPHYSVFRRAIMPTLRTRVGGGAMQTRRLYERAIYEFVLKDSLAIKHMDEYLFSFAAYHGGDVPFWFDGVEWGAVGKSTRLGPPANLPIHFGFGTGTQTQFLLPNRHVQQPGLIVYHQDPMTAYAGGYSINVGTYPGSVTFSTAPPDGVALLLVHPDGSQVRFGRGNGVQTFWQFGLRDNIYSGAAVYTLEPPDPYLATEWSIDEAPGLIEFEVPPSEGWRLSAEYYCFYKCVFNMPDEALLNEEYFYFQLYKIEGITLREVVP